ncbi:MAG: FAD:protein FMN transferase [Paracoccaceae bacterium]
MRKPGPISQLSRRRFIAISAAAATLPATARADLPVAHWRGTALGAGASMVLTGLTPGQAAPLFAGIEAELNRLENIFSLYRPASALSRLNHLGQLDLPPPELLSVLSLSSTLHQKTAGAFDPTVQPLWSLWATAASRDEVPDAAAIAAARRLTGWRNVQFDTAAIRLARPGMALTLNGIAQGYVSDRVADLLRRQGLTGILVDMGEINARGLRPDGKIWRVGLSDPDSGAVTRKLRLSNRALATSAPRGTILDRAGKIGHILDPRTGHPAARWRQVSVSAPSAALADGLSTAFCLMEAKRIGVVLATLKEVRLESILA